MTYRYLTDLATVARRAGLDVLGVSGWQSRGRPESTGGNDPSGVLWHHTGGAPNDAAYADWLARVGRSDLPAPLCHLSINRAGTVFVIAAGRTNHGGKAKASGPIPAGDANALYIGVECMNTGSEGWSPEQYGAMVKLGAALAKAYGWSAEHNRAHKETSMTGKWDPGQLNMTDFREDIRMAMAAGPTQAVRKKARAMTTRTIRFFEKHNLQGEWFLKQARKRTHRKNTKK